jgi:hypothetical protein
MNYLKVYCNLIRKAENRTPPESCVERHHTFPKGLFGDNDRIVILTPREHYIAHLLLEKICIKRYGVGDEKTKKMTLACLMMRNRSEKYNSHLYEQVRMRYIENMREKMKGEGNPCYGVPCSEERKKKIREKALGRKASQETRDKMSRTRKGKKVKNPKCRKYFRKMDDLEFRENFIKIVEISYTKTEVAEKMGYKSCTNIDRWIKELELDTSHFLGSLVNVGRKHTEQARENIRKSKLGEKNPFYGKTHSQEVKVKMSEERKGERNSFYGKTHNEETKKKQAEAKIGTKWWNDGKVNRMSKECPGDGWIRGKLKKPLDETGS